MKNKFLVTLTLILLFMVAAPVFAVDYENYSPAFKDGDMAVQAGIGLIPVWGYYGDMTVPPISVSFDMAYPVAELPLSFGGYVGYSASDYEYYSGSGWKYTYIMLGAKAAYHVDFDIDKLDTYAGILLGYNIVSVEEYGTSWAGYSASGSFFSYGGYVGARYFFTPNLAAFGEFGYSIGLINLGATYKF